MIFEHAFLFVCFVFRVTFCVFLCFFCDVFVREGGGVVRFSCLVCVFFCFVLLRFVVLFCAFVIFRSFAAAMERRVTGAGFRHVLFSMLLFFSFRGLVSFFFVFYLCFFFLSATNGRLQGSTVSKTVFFLCCTEIPPHWSVFNRGGL